MPCEGSANPLRAMNTMTIPPRSGCAIPVQASGTANLKEEDRWGTVKGNPREADKPRIKLGITRLNDDDDKCNWVDAENHSDNPMFIREGDIIAHFTPRDMLEAQVLHVLKANDGPNHRTTNWTKR